MKKIRFIILGFAFCLVANGCIDKVDIENLKVSNHSNNVVYSIISSSDTMFNYEKFLLAQRLKKGEDIKEFDITDLFISDEILPNAIIEVPRPMVWGDFIEKSKDNKLRLFLIDKDSIDKYGWEYIHANNIYNKKQLLTKEDLEKIKWNVVYK